MPILPIQYADFAHWQRQWLTKERLETQLNYWHKQLSGVPNLLALPTDRPRQAIQEFRLKSYLIKLDITLTQQLINLSKQTDTTLFMILLSVFYI